MLRRLRSPRFRLQCITVIAGVAYVYCITETPSLAFTQLPRAFPSGFHARHGFFHVMRWLEHLDSADDLSTFLQTMASIRQNDSDHDAAHKQIAPTIRFRTAAELLAHMVLVSQWETYLLVSKMALQWGLLVFLSRAKAIASRMSIASVCLGILSFMCAKIAQSCLLELLISAGHRGHDDKNHGDATPMRDRNRAAFMTAFISMLFLLRFAAITVLNGAMARAYQVYFGGWPDRWREMPRYLGSKDFALSTMFYSVAAVGAMAISTPSLRSLSEAAHHIESAALVAAWCHFLVHEFGGFQDPTADVQKGKTKTA